MPTALPVKRQRGRGRGKKEKGRKKITTHFCPHQFQHENPKWRKPKTSKGNNNYSINNSKISSHRYLPYSRFFRCHSSPPPPPPPPPHPTLTQLTIAQVLATSCNRDLRSRSRSLKMVQNCWIKQWRQAYTQFEWNWLITIWVHHIFQLFLFFCFFFLPLFISSRTHQSEAVFLEQ